MPESTMPRYLTHAQAMRLRTKLEHAIAMARAEIEADSNVDSRGVDHELGIMLARAACRLDLDLLQGASSTIERLEAVVAELGANLEQAKIGGPDYTDYAKRARFANGSHQGNEKRTNGHVDPYVVAAEAYDERALAEAGYIAHDPHCRCSTCRQ